MVPFVFEDSSIYMNQNHVASLLKGGTLCSATWQHKKNKTMTTLISTRKKIVFISGLKKYKCYITKSVLENHALFHNFIFYIIFFVISPEMG